jgi:hypothetical protein
MCVISILIVYKSLGHCIFESSNTASHVFSSYDKRPWIICKQANLPKSNDSIFRRQHQITENFDAGLTDTVNSFFRNLEETYAVRGPFDVPTFNQDA